MIFDDIVLPEVVQIIRENLPVSVRSWDIACTPDQRVLADRGGKKFINVYPAATLGGPSLETQEEGFDYYDGFNVGVTYRHANIAPDRMWTSFMNKTDGPVAMIRNVTGILRKFRLELLGNINRGFTASGTGYKLVEPYRLSASSAEFIEVGPDHFNADPELKPERLSTSRSTFGLWTSIPYGLGRIMVSFDDLVVGEDITTTEAAFTTAFSLAFDS